MAIANASTQRRPDRNEEERSVGEARRVYGEIDGAGEGNNEAAFEIKRRVEVSEMAHMFLGRKRVLFTYFALTVYLFGDLAIYSATVPKSLMNIIWLVVGSCGDGIILVNSAPPPLTSLTWIVVLRAITPINGPTFSPDRLSTASVCSSSSASACRWY